MSMRSLVIAAFVIIFGFAAVADVQAKSKNNSHSSHSEKSAPNQASSGTSTAAKKASGQTQAKHKKAKPALGTITFTKHYDQSSPY